MADTPGKTSTARPKRAATARKPAAKPATAKAKTARTTKPKAAPAVAAPSLTEQVNARVDTIRSEAQRKAGEIGDEVTRLAGQAGDRARELARQGKDKTASGLDSLAKVIEDSAGTVDDKLGKQYGDFARSAATTVAGLAGTLEQQDIDELVESTREFVKKSPAVAIGSAAVVGFMLARLLRGSNRA